MEFRPKFDSFYKVFLTFVALTISAVLLIPLIVDRDAPAEVWYVIVPLNLATLAFLAWSIFSIKYVLTMDYLYVQGGPFRSRIPYRDITKVAPTRNVWYGYRLTTSLDSIEIFYRKALLGSVKISPQDPERFIAELKKRCPNAVFEPLH